MLVCTLGGEGGGRLKKCTVCTLMKMLTFLDGPLYMTTFSVFSLWSGACRRLGVVCQTWPSMPGPVGHLYCVVQGDTGRYRHPRADCLPWTQMDIMFSPAHRLADAFIR